MYISHTVCRSVSPVCLLPVVAVHSCLVWAVSVCGCVPSRCSPAASIIKEVRGWADVN